MRYACVTIDRSADLLPTRAPEPIVMERVTWFWYAGGVLSHNCSLQISEMATSILARLCQSREVDLAVLGPLIPRAPGTGYRVYLFMAPSEPVAVTDTLQCS